MLASNNARRTSYEELISEIYKQPPLIAAKEFISASTGKNISDDQWWAMIQRVWFEQFDSGKNRDLSGFEHVVVGEQKQGSLGGYHSWYKYFLDEHFKKNDEDQERDSIDFLSWKNGTDDTSAETATLSFVLNAFDYEALKFRKLTKPIGGFWIGPSIPGLIALGMVRFEAEAFAPKTAIINDIAYNLHLYRSPNGKHMRTFYPEFKKMK